MKFFACTLQSGLICVIEVVLCIGPTKPLLGQVVRWKFLDKQVPKGVCRYVRTFRNLGSNFTDL